MRQDCLLVNWLICLCEGLTQSRGFGMFEIADLCSSIGCYPIITINNLELPSDMADFVEV